MVLQRGLDDLDLGRQGGLGPGGQVNEQVRTTGDQGARPGGELLHQLGIPPGAADAVQAPQPCQDGLHLRSGEEGTVHPIPLQDGDAAPGPLGGDQRDARLAQGLHIPPDGAGGDLKQFRQGRGRHLLLLEQNGQDADEPFQFHGGASFAASHFSQGARPGRRLMGPVQNVLSLVYHRNRTAVCPVPVVSGPA